MSYQVIARKYRPQKFADVVGQEHVTQTLANAITQKRIAHAYLFCGPRGTGKTTIARIFAKALNCTGGPKIDFNDSDPRVQEITEGRSLDVLEIDGASNNGVEQVRELRETCKYAPANSPFKIYIIDEVHMLSTAAFNALLKTLEEPPAHVKFMFATTDPEKVLPTILSRCQRYDLRRIPAALITKHLAEIAGKEKVTIDAAALHAIARGADGGMRDAESTLDQLISFCGDKIEEADVLSMFGLAAQNQILKLSRAVLAGEISTALTQLDELARGGKDLGRLLGDLLNHFRNLLIYQVSKGDLNLLEASEAEVTALKEQAGLATTDAFTRVLEVLADAELRLRDAASKKILLEVTLLRAIEARNSLSLDAVLKQLNQLRGEGGASVPPAAISAPAEAAERRTPIRQESKMTPQHAGSETGAPTAKPATLTPVAAAPAAVAAVPLSDPVSGIASPTDDLNEMWEKLMDAFGRVKPLIRSYLEVAIPISFEKGAFSIGIDPEFEDRFSLVNTSINQTLLATKLKELGYPCSTVKFVLTERPIGYSFAKAAPSTPPISAVKPAVNSSAEKTIPKPPTEKKPVPVAFNKDEFKNDPLIKRALEIFKGEITAVWQ
ncbi:MAG TPA: DNA polymerase III subunit gamma/tau [Candidatus Acidoferrales bacterium]|jgi:DNA polymerase-3 subunit gamma/tau|nr:DNA polymerase III subunit gamma/tau [Candidatus Acidoferrales bacterium]